MVQVKEGKLIGSGIKVGIVVARFNEFICSRLLGGAYDAMMTLRQPGFPVLLKFPS